MKCDNCKKDLHCGAVLTYKGNEIEYMECENCGLVEVMGQDVEASNE